MKYGFDIKEEKRFKKIVRWLVLLIIIAVIYFTRQAIESSKVYYVEERTELAPAADSSNIPFGIMMKVGAMPWEDIVWNDETKMLHMTIRNREGTIENAEELRTYHMTPSGLLQGGMPLSCSDVRGLLTIRLEYRFENSMLTFVDKKYQKELCKIDLSEALENGQSVNGISVGQMSDITISENGEKIYLYIIPGYKVEEIPGKVFYKNMPMLKAEIAWEYDDNVWNASYEIGEFDVAWINEEPDAILTRISEIDKNGLRYDEVEWVDSRSTRRNELTDQGAALPEGICIYNETEEVKEAVFSEDCEFITVNGMNHDELLYVNKEQMIRRIKWERDEKVVYYLVIEEGQIVKLQEDYAKGYYF
ncbi:MAG: hypothetical protein IJ024_07915 [Lachnospiraceae bacterium]|nr:hypothetical protein [Lachnospiraceae bacterium]